MVDQTTVVQVQESARGPRGFPDYTAGTLVGNSGGAAGQPAGIPFAEVKTALELDQVDNTPDADKPVSTPQQTALDARVQHVATRAALALAANTTSVFLHEAGREGIFVFSPANLVTEVGLDTQQGVYVPPAAATGLATDGSAGAWVRHPGIDTWYNAAWFGATGLGVADDTTAIQTALNLASPKAKSVLLPAGTYKVTDGGRGYGLSLGSAKLVGTGRGKTFINYVSAVANTIGIKLTSDQTSVESLTIDGTANATAVATVGAAGCPNIKLVNVNHCKVSDVETIGGHYGVWIDNSLLNYTANIDISIIGCYAHNCASSGFHNLWASFAKIRGNHASGCGTDGFKFGGGFYEGVVEGNTSIGNTRDGMDFYDGFINSVLANNVAVSNGFQGYEIKGLFDGTYGAGDYVVRGSSIIGNVALLNGTGAPTSGFALHSMRACTISANISALNSASGFEINDLQGCSLTGNVASRNTMHGFDLANSVSRTIFSGNYAVDNSWAGGTVQNGTYHGFHISTGCAAQFNGDSALNGTLSSKIGGQGYGFYFDAGSSGSRLNNIYTLANVTGGIGGDVGWSANNYISSFGTNNGAFLGLRYNSDALTALQGDVDINLVRAGNATFSAARTAGATVALAAQTALGLLGTTSNHPLRLQVNATQVLEITTAGILQPLADNTRALGGVANRWLSIYTMALLSSGAVTSNSATAGIGYAAGARGTVAQATSKATPVVSNTVATDITLNAASLAAGANVSFVFTNSAIGVNDTLILNHVTTGTFGGYSLNAHGFAAGSCIIDVRNLTAGALAEAIVIRAVLIKGG